MSNWIEVIRALTHGLVYMGWGALTRQQHGFGFILNVSDQDRTMNDLLLSMDEKWSKRKKVCSDASLQICRDWLLANLLSPSNLNSTEQALGDTYASELELQFRLRLWQPATKVVHSYIAAPAGVVEDG
ncbi:hypothetical protein AXG93_2964s1100 [Marchantia polymorpha subsp. ruderalis]|uniref:Uncharacterized protein n=1 Tax=Marchantia polymorpha subsp. ruderalis TaxID=1480154 RepID=A0A176VKA4_MARPO|nr:hypothetical protein AXG93_2964s1100 [Marchantia polymorpha subsp. ruderalis]